MTGEIDPTHSHVSFAIRVMAVSTTRGRFNALRGQLYIDEQNPANCWVDAQVEAASIDTRNKLRDSHLRYNHIKWWRPGELSMISLFFTLDHRIICLYPTCVLPTSLM